MMGAFTMNLIENEVRCAICGDMEFLQSIQAKDISGADVTREILQRFQVYRLNKMIDYAREHSPFYRERLLNDFSAGSIHDLTKLPFTTHVDLRDHPHQLLCVSLTGVARVFTHFTTGTLGRPKKIFFSEKDVERIVRSMSAITANVINGAGLDPRGAKVAIYLPNSGRPLSMAEMIARGVRLIGGDPFIGSCHDATEEQIEEILAAKPDVLMGSAFRIWRITQEGRETRDLRKANVKAVFITSEYLSSTMRTRLEKAWGATVFHHYGMTEPGFAIGIECGCHCGYHYNESDLLFEVVNPATGEPVGDGEEGELVFTSLAREAMPFIRYRTGDIASITQDACPCGSSLLSRIGVMPKKIGLIYELKTGEQIYASLFDEALYELDDLIDYRIFLTNEEGFDKLLCTAEMLGNDPSFINRLERQLIEIPEVARAVKAGALAIPTVALAPCESLRRGGMSLKRKIEDNRQPVAITQDIEC